MLWIIFVPVALCSLFSLLLQISLNDNLNEQ